MSRLLTGRIATVIQCFLSIKMLNRFHPRVFDVHVKAAKNFEEYLSPPGPRGPLEMADIGSYTDSEFEQWMHKREEAVFKQLVLVSQLIAEVSVNILPRNEAKMLLEAARACYEGECQDPATLKKCLKTFDQTEDMI